MLSARIRILSVVTNLIMGGDANRLLNFARTIDRSRFEHRVLTLVPPDHPENRAFGLMLPTFERCGISVDTLDEEPRSQRRLRQRGMSLLWDDTRSCVHVVSGLTRYLRQHEIDVIDARMTYATVFSVIAGRLAGIRAIVSTCYGPDDDLSSRLRNVISQAAFSRVDTIISDSQYAIDKLQRWALRPHPRAVVIPNGVFVSTAQRSRAEVRRFFELPDDPGMRVICQVSRLVSYKGHRVLLAAARRVLDCERDVAFLFCGYSHPPAYAEELLGYARELGIADHVRIRGYPGPVGDVWRATDIHVHASLLDSSPIAIHESMALGLPAVVTNVGGIPELVRDDETALVVPPGDERRLAEALIRILRNPELGRSLGAAARQRFCAHYRPECMTRALEALFSGLVPKHDDSPERVQ